MSEQQGQEQQEQPGDTNVEVQGDAVINQAPDGGGVDNNAAGEGSSEGSDSE